MTALLVTLATACPDCPPARHARQLFWSTDLAHNALVAVSPFIVVIAIVALIVRALSNGGSDGRP